jgi:hypothetical protein
LYSCNSLFKGVARVCGSSVARTFLLGEHMIFEDEPVPVA